jgi:hypothetical protein
MVTPLFKGPEERIFGRFGLAAVLAVAEVMHKGIPDTAAAPTRIKAALAYADAMIAEAERSIATLPQPPVPPPPRR